MPIKTPIQDSAVARLYLRSDHNKDKTITLDELTAQLAKDGISKAQAQAAFRAADRDNNGKVTVEEVRQRALEVKRAQNAGLSPADLNKDGLVTKGELAALPTALSSRQTAFFLDLLGGGSGGEDQFFTQHNTRTRAYTRPAQPAQSSKTIQI